MDITWELAKLGVVGLISGLFASYLANRDHRYRKWWELRVAAYQGVIESLSDLVYYYNNKFDAEIEQHDVSAEFEKQLSDYWDGAFPRIRKAADSGAFLFSDKANTALSNFMVATQETRDSYFDELDHSLAAAKLCLKELVALSKADLQLKLSWLDRLT